jgi:hypothetical protein
VSDFRDHPSFDHGAMFDSEAEVAIAVAIRQDHIIEVSPHEEVPGRWVLTDLDRNRAEVDGVKLHGPVIDARTAQTHDINVDLAQYAPYASEKLAAGFEEARQEYITATVSSKFLRNQSNVSPEEAQRNLAATGKAIRQSAELQADMTQYFNAAVDSSNKRLARNAARQPMVPGTTAESSQSAAAPGSTNSPTRSTKSGRSK